MAEQTSADPEVLALGDYSCPLAVSWVTKVMDFKKPILCSVFKGWVVSFDLQTRGKDRYKTAAFFSSVLLCFVSVCYNLSDLGNSIRWLKNSGKSRQCLSC